MGLSQLRMYSGGGNVSAAVDLPTPPSPKKIDRNTLWSGSLAGRCPPLIASMLPPIASLTRIAARQHLVNHALVLLAHRHALARHRERPPIRGVKHHVPTAISIAHSSLDECPDGFSISHSSPGISLLAPRPLLGLRF